MIRQYIDSSRKYFYVRGILTQHVVRDGLCDVTTIELKGEEHEASWKSNPPVELQEMSAHVPLNL